MDETLTELSGAETEIEDLLAGYSSPEGIKPRFRVEDKRNVGEGIKVSVSVWQDPDKPRHVSLSVIFPKDELGRHVSEDYEFTGRKYKKTENPDYRAGGAARYLENREMNAQDEVNARSWLDRYKAAGVASEGEVVDDKKEEEGK